MISSPPAATIMPSCGGNLSARRTRETPLSSAKTPADARATSREGSILVDPSRASTVAADQGRKLLRTARPRCRSVLRRQLKSLTGMTRKLQRPTRRNPDHQGLASSFALTVDACVVGTWSGYRLRSRCSGFGAFLGLRLTGFAGNKPKTKIDSVRQPCCRIFVDQVLCGTDAHFKPWCFNRGQTDR